VGTRGPHALNPPWVTGGALDLPGALRHILRAGSPDPCRAYVLCVLCIGRNATRVRLGGGETEAATRGGRKRYMLSGWQDEHGVVIRCRVRP
jgi:hypothetical protein